MFSHGKPVEPSNVSVGERNAIGLCYFFNHIMENKDEAEFFKQLYLLIIDDLGSEFSTQFTVSCVYNIINSRILSGKPTIISTNLTPGELEDKYTQRITSRIIGSYISIKFIGRDIRQLKRY